MTRWSPATHACLILGVVYYAAHVLTDRDPADPAQSCFYASLQLTAEWDCDLVRAGVEPLTPLEEAAQARSITIVRTRELDGECLRVRLRQAGAELTAALPRAIRAVAAQNGWVLRHAESA